MNVQLQHVISDLTGVTGQAILQAILAGERDPQKLAARNLTSADVVAALRETSILFAVLIGWLVFGEKMTGGKALAAVVIVAGVLLTRL